MKCADPECAREATRKLHGIEMCEEYYREALEHSAHLVVVNYQKVLVAEIRAMEEHIVKVNALVQANSERMKRKPK